MARPDKSYLEKQTARRPEKKKKTLGEGSTDSRMAKISFKNYLRQIEEEELYNESNFNEDDDMDDEDQHDGKYRFIVVDEGHWDDPETESSTLEIHELSEDELQGLGFSHLEEISEDEDRLNDFCDALRNHNIGRVVGTGKISNPRPKLGSEGIIGPDGVELLFPTL